MARNSGNIRSQHHHARRTKTLALPWIPSTPGTPKTTNQMILRSRMCCYGDQGSILSGCFGRSGCGPDPAAGGAFVRRRGDVTCGVCELRAIPIAFQRLGGAALASVGMPSLSFHYIGDRREFVVRIRPALRLDRAAFGGRVGRSMCVLLRRVAER